MIIGKAIKIKSAPTEVSAPKNATPIVATQIFTTSIRERRKGSMHFYQKQKCALLMKVFDLRSRYSIA